MKINGRGLLAVVLAIVMLVAGFWIEQTPAAPSFGVGTFANIVPNSYGQNGINFTANLTVIQQVYLVNNTGQIVHYPHIGGTYFCVADINPKDNNTISYVTWNYAGDGIVAGSNVNGVQQSDLLAWYSGTNFTPTTEGILQCNVTEGDSTGAVLTFNQTFQVTTALSCTGSDEDVCNLSGNYQQASTSYAPTYRYANITIPSGDTLTCPYNNSLNTTVSGAGCTLIADNYMNISGTALAQGNAAFNTTLCQGGKSGILTLSARQIDLSGAAQTVGGAGISNCISGQSASGGVANPVIINAMMANITGTLNETAGNKGTYATNDTSFSGPPGAMVESMQLNVYELTVNATINLTGGAAANSPTASSNCNFDFGVAGFGGDVDPIIISYGRARFIGGTVTETAGAAGNGSTNSYTAGSTCGGTGGNVYGPTITTEEFTNAAVWTFTSGKGGNMCGLYNAGHQTQAGASGNAIGSSVTTYNVSNVTQTLTLSVAAGGAGGTQNSCASGSISIPTGPNGTISNHTVIYNYVTAGNNFSNYLPNATVSTGATPHAPPLGNLRWNITATT